MKKRNLLWIAALFCLIAAGCKSADAQSESVVSVEELPIESIERETVSPEEIRDPELPDKEPYEELEIEILGDKGVITVGTTGAPYTELLTQARIQLAKEGWDLQIKRYDDYQKLSADVLEGTLDAHLFAHSTYIESYNDVNKTNLTSVAPVCYEVYGIYSKLNQDLTQISGSVIAIPQDATDKARTLLFMDDLEWIVLKEGVGMTAIEEDITENTLNIQFVEYTQETFLQVMEECDYCIAGADMAIAEGLEVKEAIRTEKPENVSASLYASLLVTTQEKAEDEKMQILVSALTSDETKAYAKETYKGAWDLIQ